MRTIATALVYGVFLLTLARHFGVTTHIVELDRWVAILLASIHDLHGYFSSVLP